MFFLNFIVKSRTERQIYKLKNGFQGKVNNKFILKIHSSFTLNPDGVCPQNYKFI